MLAALAFGGSSLASAASKQSPPVQQQSAVDSGPNVQQGDQSAPDTGSTSDPSSETATPESESASESQSESAASDGPGGYADTGANADTQQTGEH
jgi:hypothetical protein